MTRSARREKIEEAAARLFADRGYEAASLEEVASAAGISKRVIYDHFPSKLELHLALLDAYSQRLWARVAEGASGERTLESRFRAGAEAFFEFVEGEPYAWRMLFRDPPAEVAGALRYRELDARTSAIVTALLVSDPGSAEAVRIAQPTTVDMTAEMLKAVLDGLAAWWYEHREVPRQDVVSAFMGFVWLGLERLAEGGRWLGREA